MEDLLGNELLRDLPQGRAGLRLQLPTHPIPLETSVQEAAPVLAEALVITTANEPAARALGFASVSEAIGANGSRWWSFDRALEVFSRLWERGTIETDQPPLRLTLIEGPEGIAGCALSVLEAPDDPGRRLERSQDALAQLEVHIAAIDGAGRVAEVWGGWDPQEIGHWAAELTPGSDAIERIEAAARLGAPGAAALGTMLGEVLRGERSRGQLDIEWEGAGRSHPVLAHLRRRTAGALLIHYGLTSLRDTLDADRRLEAVGRLAGGVAHDFNNLLTAISGYCELMLSTVPDDSLLRGDLLEIRAAGERAAALTQQLLAFSCRQVLRPRPLPLTDLIEEVRPALERLVGDDVELAIEGTHRLPPVSVDPEQLQRVVLNLAHNAREAMPAGGRLTIRHGMGGPEAPPGGPYVRLDVVDTGAGMSDATLALACEPFFTTRGQAGMGLATVYGIVKQTGGHVTLASAPDVGTTVQVFLPQATPQADATPTPGTARSRIKLDGQETILLVEDERPVRDLLNLVLTRRGYTVLEAEDGETALALIADHDGDLDLVVSDVVMPRIDGVELVRRLREARPGIGVLFVSGYTPASLSEHGSPLDPNEAFLGKPFTPHELLRAVRDVLDRS